MKMLLFLFSSLMLCSCGPDKYPISFHMETGATDSKKFAFERDGHYYSKAPLFPIRTLNPIIPSLRRTTPTASSSTSGKAWAAGWKE